MKDKKILLENADKFSNLMEFRRIIWYDGNWADSVHLIRVTENWA